MSEEGGSFRIGDSGKCLGIFLGPGPLERSWRAPLAKWRVRAADLAKRMAPATALLTLYPQTAASVLH